MLFFVIGIQRRFFRSQNCLDISWFLFRQLLDGHVGRHRLYSGRDEYGCGRHLPDYLCQCQPWGEERTC